MIRQMVHLLAVVLLCLVASGAWSENEAAGATSGDAQITDLDALLQTVREQQKQQRALLLQRELTFKQNRDRQQALLAKARQDFEASQRKNQPLVAVTEANAGKIENLQQELAQLLDGMGDISGTFREFSGDAAAVLGESMITAQFPQRSAQLRALAASEGAPTIDEIESLWLLLLQEMTEAGKVASFTTPVVSPGGLSAEQPVVRAGAFSVYGDAGFLRFISATNELLEPSRQPGAAATSTIRRFLDADGATPVTTLIDPSRGNLLGMMSYTPSLGERIDQGGLIARIIIALGVIGLMVTAWRSISLALVYLHIRRQLRHMAEPARGNPLGRVMLAVRQVPADEEALLQLKLDEAILTEIPALERGNSLIKLLAAIAPLLGLLGTVTGMILTFQAISLFGTGDPKLMAGGISQALVTTVLGLVVAIPLLFGHSLVATLSRSVIQRLDEQSAGVLAREAERQSRA